MNTEAVKALELLRKSLEERLAKQDDAIASLQDRENKAEAKTNRERLGLGGLSEASGVERKALETWLRSGDSSELKTMSLSPDPSGGYLVPGSFAQQIASVGAEQGAIRKLASVFQTDTGDFHIPVATNLAAAAWTNESGTRSNTATPDLAKVHPLHGGLYAVAPVSNWLLGDAGYDVADFVTRSIGESFGASESASFVSGNGVNRPSGFLANAVAATADATRPFGTVEKLHAGSTSTFDVDSLISLVGKLAPRYRKNAAFVAHPDTTVFVRKLKSATSGDYYWQPSTQAGDPPTMLGLPWLEDVNMPTIASAAAVVAVADWKRAYAIVDIGQPLMIRDQVSSKGFTLFYVEKRVGGAVVDSNALKLLVMST